MGPLWNVILIEVIIWHLSTFLECLHCTCRTHSLVCVSVSLCVCTIHEHNLWVNLQLSDLYKSSICMFSHHLLHLLHLLLAVLAVT